MEDALAELKSLQTKMRAYIQYFTYLRYVLTVRTYLCHCAKNIRIFVYRTRKSKRSLGYLVTPGFLLSYLDKLKLVLDKMIPRSRGEGGLVVNNQNLHIRTGVTLCIRVE